MAWNRCSRWCGARTAGWSTSIVLTSSRGSSTSWSIVSGSDKVSLSSSGGGQVTLLSTPAAVSAAIGDIVIRATSGAETADHAITERTPYSLQSSAGDVTIADATYTYMTTIEYRILDQFSTVLPFIALPINEQWTSAVVDDYPKNNWRRGTAGGLTILPADASRFVDGIGGEIPSRRPTPVLDPASTTAIQHWGQAWQIGSTNIGVGRRVQTNLLQKNIGRALHTNIVSPP